MAQFITRVELHSARNELDYLRLHSEMSKEGFSRTILANDGKTYQLPTAEYNYIGNKTRSQVLDSAKRAANATGHSSWILVTEAVGCNFDLAVAR